ncbi:MAG TPA: DUF5683 domain-containing protein [Bacteroidales bacterium]|nr:hypothetical protein [Bacteroidales bacterium]MDI9572898.1 DUF5683 domain-containing protein [Bacteroidota bacterium]MBP9510871.1 hypothetical protein [Bacteroidales bacterium]MBP9587797.1 hypothetical protein [Bacteroidales bacterium]HOE58230.1 DUF5683 domain-containing protein [Bacteroidales bacterium]
MAGFRNVILFLCILFLFPSICSAQQDTVVRVRPSRSPRTATILSLVLPGMGQAYNHKYWKIPIIYTGFAATGYFAIINGDEYHKFKDAYNFKINNLTGDPPNDYAVKYTADQLRVQRDYYRRNMELSYIIAGFIYILNAVDASVDAHLSSFDISENLSMGLIAPSPPIADSSPFISPSFGFTYKIPLR